MSQPIFDRLEAGGRLDTMKKYATSELKGKFDLLTGNNIEGFEGQKETEKKLGVILEFPPSDISDVSNRLVRPLQDIESELGLQFDLVGRDTPFHCTILTGKTEEESLGTDIAEGILKDPEFTRLVDKILETEINYGLLLYQKGNLLLAASDIPESIQSARDLLEKKYKQVGLQPAKLLNNFLHCTISRMKTLPSKKEWHEKVDRYLKMVQPLRIELSQHPLRLKPHNVYVGDLGSFLKKKQYP